MVGVLQCCQLVLEDDTCTGDRVSPPLSTGPECAASLKKKKTRQYSSYCRPGA